jgi:alpha-L-fucosidase
MGRSKHDDQASPEIARVHLNKPEYTSGMKIPSSCRWSLVLRLGFSLISSIEARAQTDTNAIADGGNSSGYDMAPETRLEVVEAAVTNILTKLPPGPFQPSWESLKANYRVPQWFGDAKFGLFMHWGLYSVPAHHNEWYEKHMYTDSADGDWQVQHYGAQDQFGYKDFIPFFTQSNFNADAWAHLFKDSGAKFVIPTAQHHDNFAMWDSAVTPFNAKLMGPKRDLIGELCVAVRKQGLKFGVSNHGIEHFQFINPPDDMVARMKAEHADLFDPKWEDFYNVADRSDAACEKFLVDWYARNVELIDKYQPDLIWFDNGVDQRFLDPLKLRVAAYYYNRARDWGKEVSISAKKAAYAPSDRNTQKIGAILDFEKIGTRSPSGIRTGEWEVDDPIGSTWGYTTGERFAGTGSVIAKLVDTVSKNGTYLLNLSPKADGTFPPEIVSTLLEIGQWLKLNGEAIYGTHNWIKFGERGKSAIRFTVKDEKLFAIVIGKWPGSEIMIKSLGTANAPGGKIESVELLGSGSAPYSQESGGLRITPPATAPCKYAYVFKISGLKMNPPSWTDSGNPMAQSGGP